jgi:hypothetical protein
MEGGRRGQNAKARNGVEHQKAWLQALNLSEEMLKRLPYLHFRFGKQGVVNRMAFFALRRELCLKMGDGA